MDLDETTCNNVACRDPPRPPDTIDFWELVLWSACMQQGKPYCEKGPRCALSRSRPLLERGGATRRPLKPQTESDKRIRPDMRCCSFFFRIFVNVPMLPW